MIVTIIGLEMPAIMRKPNGIQCDECGRTEVFDRRDSDRMLADLKEKGWLIPSHCPECRSRLHDGTSGKDEGQ